MRDGQRPFYAFGDGAGKPMANWLAEWFRVELLPAEQFQLQIGIRTVIEAGGFGNSSTWEVECRHCRTHHRDQCLKIGSGLCGCRGGSCKGTGGAAMAKTISGSRRDEFRVGLQGFAEGFMRMNNRQHQSFESARCGD